ncbi:MAG: hypothetical protein AAGF60_04715 [Pseudomonadota bacterium]
MTNLSKYAVIALLTASPMAVLADTPMSGSPQQSIDADPNEYADDGTVLKNSLEGTASGSPAQSIEDDPNETALDTFEDEEGSREGTASGSPQQSIDADPNESADG